jgi:hypothetical protein
MVTQEGIRKPKLNSKPSHPQTLNAWGRRRGAACNGRELLERSVEALLARQDYLNPEP